MAVTLNNGEIVNQCDAATGFVAGGLDTDTYTEPTGSIGAKVSNTTTSFYTTTLGATAPYDFSSGGGEFGHHIIMWFNAITPANATTGFQIVVGNGTDRGRWYVPPATGYTGGFVSRVINTAAAFDLIAAGTWTLGGNPAQLTNVTQMGGALTTTTTIMGNFNNALIDQITIGTGLRADGTGNSFETIRVQDEDTTKWGWFTSSFGSFISKGGIFLGPATGTATSTFTATASVVVFAASKVAVGFFVINPRGTGTTVTLTSCVIRAETPATARWSLTIDGTSVPAFSDTGSLFQGTDVITLRSSSTLTNTTLDNGTSLVQNSSTLSGCVVLNANTADGVGYITSNNPAAISNCKFTFSDGHAITITATGTYTFSGNTFAGYSGTPGSNLISSTGSNDAAIYNNSSGAVTLNITGGGTVPAIRNGASATTTVNSNVNVTVTIVNQVGTALPGVQVSIFQNNTARTVILASTQTNASGQVSTSAAASTGAILIRARQSHNIASFLTSASGINAGTEVITTLAVHGFQTGDPIVYSKNGGSASVGLTAGTTYYVNNISTTTLSLHDTAALAIADSSRKDLNTSGTETHLLDPIRYLPASSGGTIGTIDFSAQITMVTDDVAIG